MSRYLLHYLLIAFVTLLTLDASATHNRAGEITYRHVSGFTWEVTVLTCTDISNPNNADRPYLPINWGHGNALDSIARSFESIVAPGVKRNEYTTEHTFPGPATYEIYVEDPNRNGGIVNIPTSIDVVFSITSVLVIPSDNPVGGFNNSPQLFNAPKGDACLGSQWLHNPAALDPDGDSLSYELLACTAASGIPIMDYAFPNDFPSLGSQGELTIDPLNGTVIWDSPTLMGEYNLCIRITEWRNGFFNGSVVRDMQVVVGSCINQPPVLDSLPDICVLAGSAVSQQITATDPDGDLMTISLAGESFLLDQNPSSFVQTSFSGLAQGSFQWGVNCDQVRLEPYGVFVTVRDSSTSNMFTSLTDFGSFNVQVIAPEVENLTAQAIEGQMVLDWDNNFCDNSTGYKVYRRLNSSPFEPMECETGLPESEGYELIAMVDGWSNSDYVDANVPFGFDVCYRIVSCFADGAESIVSEEACASINREIPILTHVSVGETDMVAGVDTVRWLSPNELDTVVEFTGEFFYKLYRTEGLVGERELVETTSPSPILDLPGGFEFIDTSLDTETNIHTYDVEIFHFINGQESLISTSNPALSIFLTVAPLDQSLQLSWTDMQPWDNYLYEIYIEDVNGDFIYLDETSETEYLHDSLMNGLESCYLIKAFGEYNPLTGIAGPFINFSQEVCGVPIDLTPPCPPVIEVNGNCEEGTYSLSWSNPNDFCADDVTEYNLYYSATEDGELEYLTTIVGAGDTSFVPTQQFPVGCYAITALDTRTDPDGTEVMNESILSNTVCLEGCPVYTLPNVITPNGDDINDFFRPFDGWTYVDSVDFKIFNRWGNLIFETSDPQLMWQGTALQSDQRVSDGVYFYHIDIFEVTLQGRVPRQENGTIHVFRNRSDFKQ